MKLFTASLIVLFSTAPLRAMPLGTGNDDCTGATVLTTGTHTGFHLSDRWVSIQWFTDWDWYRFTVQPGEMLTVQMNITTQSGQVGFLNRDLFEAHPTSCTDPAVPPALSLSVVNATGAPKDYLLFLFAWSAIPEGDLHLDYDLVVQTAPVMVQSYCPGAINSLGLSSTLTMQGSPSLGAADLRFTASNMNASTPAQFFCGQNQVQVPFGDGVRCVGGTLRRLKRHAANPWGTWGWNPNVPNLANMVPLLPGATWNFQLLYRDLNGPLNTGFNLSSALSITFQP